MAQVEPTEAPENQHRRRRQDSRPDAVDPEPPLNHCAELPPLYKALMMSDAL